MDLVSVNTPGVQDVIEDTLGVLNVIMAAAEGAGILIVATVSRIVTGGVAWIVIKQTGVTNKTQWTLNMQMLVTSNKIVLSDL